MITQEQANAAKSRVQAEAIAAIDANNGFGLCAMATGTGKSKIGVDMVIQEALNINRPEILLVVPTEKLRDEGWKAEFQKWSKEGGNEYNYIERTCYASLDNYKDQEWDLVILDECHNITENNSVFFKNNIVRSCIGLTATPPTGFKARLLAEILHLDTYQNAMGRIVARPTYEITLDEAVELGLVAPYEVYVVTMPIDNKVKYIKGGYKNKPKMQTEREHYDDLTNRVNFGSHSMKNIIRMQAIYNLLSKTQTAIKILEHVIPESARTLIFCGSKDQANQVCPHRYYSKPTPPKKPAKLRGSFEPDSFLDAAAGKMKDYIKYAEKLTKYEKDIKEYQGNSSFEMFVEGVIDRLSCCDALNEGHNIPLVDCAFIIQLKSSEKDLVQRIGRIIRQREGHTGKIIVLVAEETVDVDWAASALRKLDNTKVKWITIQDLKEGREVITF